MTKIDYHQLLEEFEEKIKQQEWVKGSKLPTIIELAKKYHVSVSTVREIYRAMESKGYITIQQGRGTFVTFSAINHSEDVEKSSFLELLRITEFRTIIEPAFAAMAAREAYNNEINLIVESAEIMKNMALNNEVTTSEDLRFHRLIVEATHNKYALKVYGDLQEDLKRMRAYTRRPHMVERAVQYHQMIAKAISNRNPNEARMLMESHLQSNSELAMYELKDSNSL
ncbi:FadR/GntR family transcriptional regulator [Chryseomicrobium palamuruense]|uniref:FadR/GntR family transcriptional regulator n=1 Tax=Chryseomicrobium palamuruense TaxID=682973 RepID=A0ABV8USM0_9BACL